MFRKNLVGWAFLVPLVAYLLLCYGYPLLTTVDLSIRDYTVRTFVHGGAQVIGLANYGDVFADPVFRTALLNTVVFTVASLVFQYGIGLALALFFSRRFRLSATLRALFLVPWLLPLIVSASTWAWMFNSEAGVVNAALAWFGLDGVNWLTSPDWSLVSVIVANTWIGIPFNLVVLYSGLRNIPAEVHEAAALDGASSWQAFRHVTFPMLRPVSAVTLLLGLVYTLKVFDIIWIMTRGGPGGSSTTLATWSYELGFGSMLPRFGPSSAVGNVLILMAVVAGLVYVRSQRHREAS
ncbi:carbohydrate ABC transporter permease [Saccharothrix sp. NRRL B-16314]|uniref:carbohydrate ABC transporter permease n=1 Tax=Saccharothrix sp. NRRL B-16314 TaxID=1463825 RepID=UPI00068F6C7C|nr:sugar ABC transporter permease [Saccharothrix sp. NRRL B-16314]